ncbi:MAG TPA: hypothetical protein VGR57_02845 [Ktedonobacterales bacterium]|nr:hypothetical protein [Ktedonobacterales bacterium]
MKNVYLLAALVVVLMAVPTLVFSWYLPVATRPSLTVLAVLSVPLAAACLLMAARVPAVRPKVLLLSAYLGIYVPQTLLVVHLQLWLVGTVGLLLMVGIVVVSVIQQSR